MAISLYSISIWMFITDSVSVYCAVRTGSLNQIRFRPERVNEKSKRHRDKKLL
jgi:hypothetical protein